MVQRARTDISIGDTLAEERRIIMILLVDESGCSMWGVAETLGNPAACVRRSCTTCLARRRSVPGSKISSIDERPGIDDERIVSSQGMPASRSCSNGTVISCSTSGAESPRASVCTCTVGGPNSGSGSALANHSWPTPRTTRPAAMTTTTRRSLRPDPMSHRISPSAT